MIKSYKDFSSVENAIKSLPPLENSLKIYHYTDIIGLKGILEGGFHVSHANFLNDKLEMRYCYEIALRLLRNKSDLTDIVSTKSFYKLLIDRIDLVLDREFCQENIERRCGNFRSSEFVISFSINNDSQLLWNFYANGHGYNIGLNANSLLCYFRDNSPFEIIIEGKVIYDEQTQNEVLCKKIDEFVFEYSNNPDYSKADHEELVKYFSIQLRLLACFFKSNKFNYEEEFRIVMYNYSSRNDYCKPKYRIKNNILVPYICPLKDKNVPKLPIDSISIGPLNNSDISKEGIAYFLSDLGYSLKNIDILKSEVSIR